MVIQSKKVWLADQFVPAAIEVNDGRITAILPYGTKDVDDDYGDKRIVPGFMDIHCHGAYEFDTNDANEDGLRYWAEHIVSEGVTSFLATTITQSVEVLTNAVTNVANVMESGYDGAEILGIHFEGPYLDMKYKGAQPDQYIVKPTIEQFEHYQKAARGHIRYVTLATEHDEDFALTRYLTAHGVVVSIGHSGATYEQAVMAYANGARSMTHVYNGMSPFNHRANGLVGAAYRIRTMYGEIICDGCHSTPAALKGTACGAVVGGLIAGITGLKKFVQIGCPGLMTFIMYIDENGGMHHVIIAVIVAAATIVTSFIATRFFLSRDAKKNVK